MYNTAYILSITLYVCYNTICIPTLYICIVVYRHEHEFQRVLQTYRGHPYMDPLDVLYSTTKSKIYIHILLCLFTVYVHVYGCVYIRIYICLLCYPYYILHITM